MNYKPELLAPAGSLSMGIRAYQAGADAVYLGLKYFSARQGGENFDFTELRKLKLFAQEHQKKIYVALNTIIKENEIGQVMTLVSEIALLEIDAIIIQDLGLLKIIKEEFPSLKIHASTQMVNNSQWALDLLAQNGINRTILPRETTLDQIQKLQSNNDQMELEAFIHGSLCYSYSGLCLASGLLLNRSGNRGECAQICRNYYQTDDGQKYLFSCNDLFLAEKINKLIQAGISSLKIEGRLKSEDYVYAVVKLYRYILDHKILDDNYLLKLKQDALLTYCRTPSLGYFSNSHGQNLINNKYSKNMGIPLGKIITPGNGQFSISENAKLVDKGDKILILGQGIQHKSQSVSVRAMSGNKIFFHGDQKIHSQGHAYLLQKKDKIKMPPMPSLRPWKKILPINITIIKDKILLETTYSNIHIQNHYSFASNKKTGDASFKELFNKLLKQTNQSCFEGYLAQCSPEFENIFIPPSYLKKIKNDFWKKVDLTLTDRIKKKLITKRFKSGTTPTSINRQSLSPKGETSFAHTHHLKNSDLLTKKDDQIIIPLHPLITEETYYQSLENLIVAQPEVHFSLGLNTTSHIGWLKKMNFNNVSYWCDFFIYLANPYALDWIQKQLSHHRFQFALRWVEQVDESSLFTKIEDIESIPCMISKGCIKENKNCAQCSKKGSLEISNNNNKFRLLTIDCINYLFKK